MTPEPDVQDSDAITLLYANGCSMTYGYELADDPVTHACLDDAYREQHAWPGRLAARLGCGQAVNDAVPGGSNDRIVRTTISWVLARLKREGGAALRGVLVVIGWSDPMRREYYIDGAWRQAIPYHDYPGLPALDRLNAVYRETAWNDHESAWRFTTQALALQAFLRHYGVRFVFFDALKSCQETFSAARAELAHATALDSPSYLHFSDIHGDMATVLSAAVPQWKGRHPSEAGHDHWAALLASHVARHIRPHGDVPATPSSWTLAHWWRRRRARQGQPRGPYIYP